MANEFKIKNALLIEGSTNSYPVIAIRNASTEITSDASSLLSTNKAIYDYITPIIDKNNSQDASIIRIDASLNDVIEGDSIYVKNASLGTDFFYSEGYLEVSIGTGASYLSSLLDVSITDISNNQFLKYNIDISKWENVSSLEASLYFWELSIALLKESSLGSGFAWNGTLLDVSIDSYDSWELAQDASISTLRSKDSNIDTSLNAIWTKFDNVDSSIISLNNEIIILNASIGDIGTALAVILG